MVITMSASAARIATEAATRAPLRAAIVSDLDVVRFQTTSGKPAAAMLVAMGSPMLPNPAKPMVVSLMLRVAPQYWLAT